MSVLVDVFGSSGAIRCVSCAARAGLAWSGSTNSDESGAELAPDGCNVALTSLQRVTASCAGPDWGKSADLGVRVSLFSVLEAGDCVSRFELLEASLWGCCCGAGAGFGWVSAALGWLICGSVGVTAGLACVSGVASGETIRTAKAKLSAVGASGAFGAVAAAVDSVSWLRAATDDFGVSGVEVVFSATRAGIGAAGVTAGAAALSILLAACFGVPD
jgi:hypothetical protein